MIFSMRRFSPRQSCRLTLWSRTSGPGQIEMRQGVVGDRIARYGCNLVPQRRVLVDARPSRERTWPGCVIGAEVGELLAAAIGKVPVVDGQRDDGLIGALADDGRRHSGKLGKPRLPFGEDECRIRGQDRSRRPRGSRRARRHRRLERWRRALGRSRKRNLRDFHEARDGEMVRGTVEADGLPTAVLSSELGTADGDG